MSGFARVITAPEEHLEPVRGHSIFLAGSIDLGAARDWQNEIIERIDGVKGVHGQHVIYNPRRAEWSGSTDQSMNNPDFVEQVKWEISHLHRANTVFFNFDENGKAPISLLELGFMAGIQACSPNDPMNVFVGCPPGYWRAANVEIVSREFGFVFCQDFETAYQRLHEHIKSRYA